MAKSLNTNDQIVELEAEYPQDDWDVDQLLRYVSDRRDAHNRIEVQIRELGRKQAIPNYRAGHALSVLKQKVFGRYDQVLKENKISKSWAYLAVVLYKNAPNEEAVEGMTLTEARDRYCQPKNPKKKQKPQTPSKIRQPEDDDRSELQIDEDDEDQPENDEQPEDDEELPEAPDEEVEIDEEEDLSQIDSLRTIAAQSRLIDPDQIPENDAEEVLQLLDEIEVNLVRIREGLASHVG